MITRENIKEFQDKLKDKGPLEIIKWSINHFGAEKIGFASSMSIEDQVITDIIVQNTPGLNIFTLDTGRLPQETYDLIEKTNEKYGINIELLFPDAVEVEKMVKEHGPDLFYKSIENRKLCCHIRKMEPLTKKLKTLNAWICGLRKEQSVTRSGVEVLEIDETFSVVKINPLAEWSEEKVWQYIKENEVPYNELYDKGYKSIGCAPCTSAVKEGEDVRSGRWWWESPEQKECGLHIKDGKITRKK